MRNPSATPFEIWHNSKPNISHLQPFGCTAYAKIPVESGGGLSKLDPQSVKCIMIGYFGCDAYRLYNPTTRHIFHSRDVLFEEGLSHKMLPAPSKEEIHEILPEEPTLTPITPEHTTIHPTKSSDPPTCCSTCTRVTTQAAIDSQASEHTIEEAQKAGMDWATDVETPTGVNSAKVFHNTTNAPMSKLPDPLNYWLPDSYTDAMSRPDIWAEPISKELNVMKTWNVWDIIDPPENARLVSTRWTFANKYNADGNLIVQKARLVAKGFTQIPGVDFFETYASVVRYESLRMNLAIAAALDMEAWQVDYVAAYLNSHPQAITYIELPDGAKVKGKIGQLNKMLYGMMDGAYNWAEMLNKEMGELGYYRSKADPAVWSRHANSNITITSTYTDDTMGISSSKEEAECAKDKLGWTYETKDLGDANLILGIRIDRD